MTGSPMLVMVIVLAAVTGCGPAPVTETRAATPVAFGAHIPGVSVEEALAYLEEHTLECAGPRQPEAKTREWLCRTEYADGSSLDVRLVGDQAGVSQLVGVARNASPDETVSYLVGSVAGLVATGRSGDEVLAWAADHPDQGRKWNLESATVRLQSHSEARAIIVDPPAN